MGLDMDKSSDILILDDDPTTRAAIEQALRNENLMSGCSVRGIEDADFQNNADRILWLASAEIPDSLKKTISQYDVFKKPFRMGALLERVEWHRRNHALKCKNIVRPIGPYDFDPLHHHLRIKGTAKMIRLTEKESQILEALASAPEGILSRKDLLGEVWAYADNVETHTLETHIYRLRQKLEEDPTSPAFLITDEEGYRLTMTLA